MCTTGNFTGKHLHGKLDFPVKILPIWAKYKTLSKWKRGDRGAWKIFSFVIPVKVTRGLTEKKILTHSKFFANHVYPYRHTFSCTVRVILELFSPLLSTHKIYYFFFQKTQSLIWINWMLQMNSNQLVLIGGWHLGLKWPF